MLAVRDLFFGLASNEAMLLLAPGGVALVLDPGNDAAASVLSAAGGVTLLLRKSAISSTSICSWKNSCWQNVEKRMAARCSPEAMQRRWFCGELVTA